MWWLWYLLRTSNGHHKRENGQYNSEAWDLLVDEEDSDYKRFEPPRADAVIRLQMVAAMGRGLHK